VAVIRAVLEEDRGTSEIWHLTDDAGQIVGRFELAKPDGPARLAATRSPGGRLTLTWRTG
jgi:hypothetical protein